MTKSNADSICPSCDSPLITEMVMKEEVPFGLGSPASLWVKVPVFFCGECGFKWTDHRAEYIRQQAVNSAKGGL